MMREVSSDVLDNQSLGIYLGLTIMANAYILEFAVTSM